jgi:uncharacterized protein YciI
MEYYALIYDLVADHASRRGPFREEHLGLLREAHGRGNLVMAGAFSDPMDRGLLIFRVRDRAVVDDFARKDPYVVNGLVPRWEVRKWTVVVGNEPSVR